MPGTREIKRRIKSISSTKKITRAMQMISAVKMRKAQAAALASRAYSDLAWQIISNLAHKVDPKYSRILSVGDVRQNKKSVLVLVSSNRGQVGGFNSNLIAMANKFLAENAAAGGSTDLVTVGRKGRDAALRQKEHIFAEFEKYDRTIHSEEIAPIANLLIDEYLKGNYNQIVMVYTRFISTINQKAVLKKILPFDVQADNGITAGSQTETHNYEYLFEPDPASVLDYLLPKIIQAQIYQAILESDASEHSARMVMMKNATEAAGELIDDLTLTYNQFRQANITKELAEITAGRIALE